MKTTLDPSPILTASQQTPDTSHSPKDKESLKKSCRDFEAIYIQSLFKAMRKTVPESGLFEKSNSSEIYKDMLDQEIATKISKQQSIGLAEQMYRQMEKKIPSSK